MALRDWLAHWQFWSLETGFVFLLVTTAVAVGPLFRSLALPARVWIAAAALSIAAVIAVRTIPPETSRIYYDEQIYQGIGQNLADLRLAQVCSFGNAETGRLECFAGEYNKQPYGYPHLLSVVYRVVGVSGRAAHFLNAAVLGLTVFAVFLLVVQLSGNPAAGLLGGLILLLTPEALRWSATAAVEPSATLFAVIAVVAATNFAGSGSTAALLWSVAAASYAIQFRPESILILLIVGIQWARLGLTRIGLPRLAGLALGAALTVVHVAHLVAVRTEGWGTEGESISAAFVPANLMINGAFYVWDPRFPPWYTTLAIIGLAASAVGWFNRLVLGLYFTLFAGVFLFFYAGSYNYGADVRYSLTTYPPLAALAGLGLASVASRGRGRRATPGIAAAVAGLIVVWGFSWFAPHARAIGEEAWGAREDVAFAREVAATLPANSLIFTHNPSVFQLLGRNAGQMAIASPEPKVMAQWRARYGNRIYLHWNFWCNVDDPLQQQFCKDKLAQFSTELVAERVVRNYRFAFYRIQ